MQLGTVTVPTARVEGLPNISKVVASLALIFRLQSLKMLSDFVSVP